jgi:hypothetical protein
MNRSLLVEAILKISPRTIDPKIIVAEALRYISDTNLLALAISLGLDTDDILSVKGE